MQVVTKVKYEYTIMVVAVYVHACICYNFVLHSYHLNLWRVYLHNYVATAYSVLTNELQCKG